MVKDRQNTRSYCLILGQMKSTSLNKAELELVDQRVKKHSRQIFIMVFAIENVHPLRNTHRLLGWATLQSCKENAPYTLKSSLLSGAEHLTAFGLEQ